MTTALPVAHGGLRPSAKVLPGHARQHNRALVLQTLLRTDGLSRADLARETGLTRATISDLVAELLAERLVRELGQREDARPGKPATLVDIDRAGHQMVGLDMSDHAVLRAAVLDLNGVILTRVEVPLDGRTGEEALDRATELARRAVAATTAPVLGVGVGSPGVVDLDGTVQTAPNLGWTRVPLQTHLERVLGVPVIVSNDANAAALAEHGFGDAIGDLMLIRIGHGVGSGLIVGGALLHGRRFAAGEIGQVMVGTDGGLDVEYDRSKTVEAWLSVSSLEARLRDGEPRDEVLRRAGQRLGVALAPVVGALNLGEVVLSGPPQLLDGPLAEAALETIRRRTMPDSSGDLLLRMTTLGEDIVLLGAAVLVLSGRLGVS
ncbi:ROK family transcriptional regulator [Naasia sp. SYSU D00057]|uniref:ROK family transcriptional regulator n=1 Tax=Naasia sp. SYSU D00057 TaxID=2817380 RepID=UPI0027DDC986|nr:ROK family transcriptional regulator [Naasia sp. SYSU D00057]